MKWGAVIVAAGRGTRMGAAENKPYLTIAGRSVLAYTLDAFERCDMVQEIVIVAAPGEVERARAVAEAAGCRKLSAVVAGGAERQMSVLAGVEALTEADGVLVHDAARPLVKPEAIAACCVAAEREGAAALAVPVKDTIKVTDRDGFIVSTPDRSVLWAVQTPQAFARAELLEAHRLAREDGAAATDDAMLLERLGRKIAVVPGDYRNLKITTPEDLKIAELFLRE